jgi:hypothetical protein
MKGFAKKRTLIQILRKLIKSDREKRKTKGTHVYIEKSILQTDRQTDKMRTRNVRYLRHLKRSALCHLHHTTAKLKSGWGGGGAHKSAFKESCPS